MLRPMSDAQALDQEVVEFSERWFSPLRFQYMHNELEERLVPLGYERAYLVDGEKVSTEQMCAAFVRRGDAGIDVLLGEKLYLGLVPVSDEKNPPSLAPDPKVRNELSYIHFKDEREYWDFRQRYTNLIAKNVDAVEAGNRLSLATGYTQSNSLPVYIGLGVALPLIATMSFQFDVPYSLRVLAMGGIAAFGGSVGAFIGYRRRNQQIEAAKETAAKAHNAKDFYDQALATFNTAYAGKVENGPMALKLALKAVK